MKKILITLVALTTLTVFAFAQEKREIKHHGKMKNQHGMMWKQLNLTETQKAQMKAGREDMSQKMMELNKNERITLMEFRDKKFALRKAQKEKMEGLLTAEQKAKMAQLKQEHQARKEEHFAKHLENMKTELGLTDDQVIKLKAQRENMHSKIKVLKENQSLTRVQLRDQVAALKNEGKELHKKIFTEEQLKKLEEKRKKHDETAPAK